MAPMKAETDVIQNYHQMPVDAGGMPYVFMIIIDYLIRMFCQQRLATDVGRHGAAPATSSARADRVHSQIQMRQGPVVVKLCNLKLGPVTSKSSKRFCQSRARSRIERCTIVQQF